MQALVCVVNELHFVTKHIVNYHCKLGDFFEKSELHIFPLVLVKPL